MNVTKLRRLLMQDEGVRLKPYKDTVGILTIGVGRNLDQKGITEAEAIYLLNNDIIEAVSYLVRYKWFTEMSDVRQAVLISMYHNIGPTKLKKFKNFMAALEVQDYVSASREMLNSTWAKQVGARATRLAKMMISGYWL